MTKRRIGIDFDGTIVDCRPKQMHCLSEAARLTNINIDVDKIWGLKRSGLSNRDALLSLGFDKEHIEIISSFWRQKIESKEYVKFDLFLPDVPGVLNDMSNNFSLHLISARKDPDIILNQLKNLEIHDLFETISIVAQPLEDKASVMRNLDLQFYIGDTEIDFRACVMASTKPIIVCTGQRSEEFLYKNGVGIVYKTLSLGVDRVVND